MKTAILFNRLTHFSSTVIVFTPTTTIFISHVSCYISNARQHTGTSLPKDIRFLDADIIGTSVLWKVVPQEQYISCIGSWSTLFTIWGCTSRPALLALQTEGIKANPRPDDPSCTKNICAKFVPLNDSACLQNFHHKCWSSTKWSIELCLYFMYGVAYCNAAS